MPLLRKLLSYFFSQWAYQYAARTLKRKALLVYLRTLQIARKSVLAAIVIFCILQVMVFGFIGSVVIGVWVSPLETETKLYTLLGIFLTFLLVPLILLVILFSERTWLKASGVVEMLVPQKEN